MAQLIFGGQIQNTVPSSTVVNNIAVAGNYFLTTIYLKPLFVQASAGGWLCQFGIRDTSLNQYFSDGLPSVSAGLVVMQLAGYTAVLNVPVLRGAGLQATLLNQAGISNSSFLYSLYGEQLS